MTHEACEAEPDGPVHLQAIRLSRVRDEWLPIPIYPAGSLDPIKPAWLVVVFVRWRDPNRLDESQSYDLTYYDVFGNYLTADPYETLTIALDQAQAFIGIESSDWEVCDVQLDTFDMVLPWITPANR